MVRTSRRQLGCETAVARPPFMPRLAILLDQWLVTHSPGRAADMALGVAAVAVLTAFYFGWRASTLA